MEKIELGMHLPDNIDEYIDFSSPIIKYLIEIEDKYWTSDANRNFKMVRRVEERDYNDSDDSEASIVSLEGVNTYDLMVQNIEKIKLEKKRS